jgi:fructose-1,6-bisphosphatase I
MKSMLTFEDFVLDREKKSELGTPEETRLLLDIASCCKQISGLVQDATLDAMEGATKSQNIHGDFQIPLDLAADGLLVNRLQSTEHLALVLSEEREEVYQTDKWSPRSKFVVAFDPVDGSKELEHGGQVGTIFSILRVREEGAPPSHLDFLQPGRAVVAAGMAVYGSQTMLLFTTGQGLHQFALSRKLHEWMLVNDDLKMKQGGLKATYSINEGNEVRWKDSVVRFIKDVKRSVQPVYTHRYVGSLVADAFRVMLGGGIFLYPEDSSNPKGKLRYLYEAAPIAMMVEQAGGLAVTSTGKRILDVCPADVHERSSLIIGEPRDIGRYSRFLGWDS